MMITDTLLLGCLFAAVWVLTFIPCWYLLLKLIAMSAVDTISKSFVWYFILYRVLIIAPYAVLLIAGQETLSSLLKSLIVGLILAGSVFSVLRFFFRDKIVTLLWWFYGFVYDGLLHFAPYKRLIRAVINRSLQAKKHPNSVLELGCGSGNVLIELQKTYAHDVKFTGVDSSKTMLRIARKKIKGVELVEDDIIHFLQTTHHHYDLIVMQNSLYAVQGRRILWQLLAKTLTNKGAVIITNSDRAGSKTIIDEHIQYGKRYQLFHPKLVLVGLIDSFISQLSKAGAFAFVNEHDINQEVSELFTMHNVERVYGGVNILFELRHKNYGVKIT